MADVFMPNMPALSDIGITKYKFRVESNGNASFLCPECKSTCIGMVFMLSATYSEYKMYTGVITKNHSKLWAPNHSSTNDHYYITAYGSDGGYITISGGTVFDQFARDVDHILWILTP